MVYGTCHAVIALIFLTSVIYDVTSRLRRSSTETLTITPNMVNQKQFEHQIAVNLERSGEMMVPGIMINGNMEN